MAPGSGRVWLVGGLIAAACAGCASRQILDDGGSVSFGPSNAGTLLTATALPASGPGFRVPTVWRRRGLAYGTDELVGLITEVGAVIARDQVGRELAVADLSLPHGGPSAWHRSHQTGRDVDLVFFVRDEGGRPVLPETMRRFGADGKTLPEVGPGGLPLPTLEFDDAANWRLVRALVESSVADVQYAFILDDLKQRLIDHATSIGEPPAIIAAASVLLRQPVDSAPHDDHLHVRILCSSRDRELGCQDAGDISWRKKGWKYSRPRPMTGAVALLPAAR